MQLDVRVFGGSAAQHGADQARLEIRERAHRFGGSEPLRIKRFDVIVSAEQPLIFGQRPPM